MDWNHKIWKNGTQHLSANQECGECGCSVKPIFVDTQNDPDTWFWRECDTCDDVVCEKCSDSNEGAVKCVTCLQEEMLRRNANAAQYVIPTR